MRKVNEGRIIGSSLVILLGALVFFFWNESEPENKTSRTPEHTTMWCSGSKPPEQNGQYIRNCRCKYTSGHWITDGHGLSMDLVDVPEEDGMFCEHCDIGFVWSCPNAEAEELADEKFNK